MAGELSRRGVLGSALGAIAARFLPVIPAAPVVAAPTKALLPAWIVGTPGEPDHEVIRALTREAAIALRCDECEGDDDGLTDQPDCECEFCTSNRGYEATRVPAWDAKCIVTDGDWLAAGFDANCARCGEQTSRDDGGEIVQGKPVCGCCLTLADWRLIDPERAAEMEADALADAAPTPTLKREGRS
ncbi:hypothetical protein [Methylobacterium indicum]|uniref:4Fe-4S ferredoxin-type domain-containing protein n=1 Tax=Methylobacterium indicum TaxID=1775910 RepID=A0ABR5HEQ0_9HYPH|nr:hypothetical protein [Methylobacterium indicum]KMO18865.1 hypothetical protein QR78_14180 [Methylobacterium indicum]KMO25023.1 hypothetical protein QR79_09570 [Methylobacterium indicum]